MWQNGSRFFFGSSISSNNGSQSKSGGSGTVGGDPARSFSPSPEKGTWISRELIRLGENGSRPEPPSRVGVKEKSSSAAGSGALDGVPTSAADRGSLAGVDAIKKLLQKAEDAPRVYH